MTERIPLADRRLPPGRRCAHKGPCPEEDRCATCRAVLRVHDRAWEGMASCAGLLAAANYCGPACAEDAERWAEDVAAELRSRPTWRGMHGEATDRT